MWCSWWAEPTRGPPPAESCALRRYATRVTRTARRALTMPLAVLLASMLAGCATGFLASTNQPYVPSNGSSLTVGAMDARNLLLVEDDLRPGTFSLIGALVNNAAEPETLIGIGIEGAGPIPLTPITVPGRGLITTGAEPASTILVPDATFPVGSFTTVTLTYAGEGSGTVDVLSLTAEGTTAGG